jgi:hypothetical protein
LQFLPSTERRGKISLTQIGTKSKEEWKKIPKIIFRVGVISINSLTINQTLTIRLKGIAWVGRQLKAWGMGFRNPKKIINRQVVINNLPLNNKWRSQLVESKDIKD